MLTIRNILIPTDLSDRASLAFPMAIEMCRKFDAKLHLLHVVEENLYADFSFAGGLANPPAYFEDLIEERKKRLSSLKKQIPKDVLIETTLRRGVAASEIVDEAKAMHADLLILSSHGRTGLAHLLMGSVAERIIRECPCPVLTVKAPALVMAET